MVGPVAFPLAKLAVVAVRQASRPLARVVENLAHRSSTFRNMVCLPLAQFYHYYEVKLRLAALNLGIGKVTKVAKLSEEKAVQQASEIFSEALILGLVVTILVHEYKKSKAESDQVEAEAKLVREEIRERIFNLETQLEENAEHIRGLTRNFARQHKNGDQFSKELQLALTEKPRQVERIESLEDADEDGAALKVKGNTGDSRMISEKKTMSEELEELWEEVVEEILDTVNPEDDD